MLGKIFTVCMLVMVSACLVRPEASKPNLAGIAGKVAEDVSLLLSKLGAKSTDEAIAKLWSEADDMSKADQENLVKLLKSSDGATALAALQRPVLDKLTEVDNLMTEYSKSLGASKRIRRKILDKLYLEVKNVRRYSENYKDISNHIAPYPLAPLEYPANQVPKMMERLSVIGKDMQKLDLYYDDIEDINHLYHFLPVGKLEDVIEADFVTGNVNRLYKMAENNARNNPDQLIVFKKSLENKKYSHVTHPLHRLFITDKHGNHYTRNVFLAFNSIDDSYKVEKALNRDHFIVKHLKEATIELDYLLKGLKKRAVFLDKSGISAARKAEIRAGSMRYTEGDFRHLLPKELEGVTISEWAASGISKLSNVLSKLNKQGVGISDDVRRQKSFIEKAFREIEQMP